MGKLTALQKRLHQFEREKAINDLKKHYATLTDENAKAIMREQTKKYWDTDLDSKPNDNSHVSSTPSHDDSNSDKSNKTTNKGDKSDNDFQKKRKKQRNESKFDKQGDKRHHLGAEDSDHHKHSPTSPKADATHGEDTHKTDHHNGSREVGKAKRKRRGRRGKGSQQRRKMQRRTHRSKAIANFVGLYISNVS